MSIKPPIIFLAFANDRVDHTAYLRNLPKELAGIRKALQPAVQAGLCEVIERANVTIQQILDVFQEANYRDRIAIFHYGGHANGYQLLLENTEGGHASAHSEGLVSFLAKQRGLKLVFLNGCSSQQQATELAKAGVPSVIGTSQSINDNVATALSVRFYSALGQGAHLLRAWTEAIDEAKLQHGTGNMRDLFWEGAETEVLADRFPWEIYYREGEELVRSWNLPESVDNPLFGLPEPLAQYDLPAKPYRFLERYQRNHASIFFGRSYYIRDLFNQAIDSHGPPVVLFYGQSGVGKSSMLDAGVFPRLERVSQVVYARRSQELGLEGTLRMALGLEEGKKQWHDPHLQLMQEQESQLEWMVSQSEAALKIRLEEALAELRAGMQERASKAAPDAQQHQTLKEVWMATEEVHGKPLIVLLDQAEECFTRPHSHIKEELMEFLEEVRGIFSNPMQRPQGKLIISYRKEYHPEIKEACTALAIPKSEIFLKALSRKDIIEVITGLTQTERLKKQYHIAIEEALPPIIADDLLEDKDSPIAPILQILLTKMWNMEEEKPHRLFSVEQYQHLRRQGILMGDFFKEQMGHLQLSHPHLVASGLALDVLFMHTTKLGTAGTQDEATLKQRYGDRLADIDLLLEQFKSLYLLADAGSERTGLAHDTLAPLVQDEYRHSDKPGQRASIILDNKVIAFAQNPETIIDADDLKIVESGRNGMRLWDAPEQELIRRSQAKRDRNVAAKKARLAAIISMVLIVLGFGVALAMFFSANESKKLAQASALVAEQETQKAKDAARRLENEKQTAIMRTLEAEQAQQDAEAAKAEAERSAEIAAEKEEEARYQSQEASAAKASAEESAKNLKASLEDVQIAYRSANAAKMEANWQEGKAQYELLFSKAKEIAIKSTLLNGNDTLKALLALTSYELEHKAKKEYGSFKNNDGKENTHEVFEAMEQALQRFANDSLMGGEAWAIDVKGRKIMLSEAKGRAFVGELQVQPGKHYPALKTIANYTNMPTGTRVYATRFTGESDLVVGMGNGQVMRATQKEIIPLYKHGDANLLALSFLPQKQWVASAATKGPVKIWDLVRENMLAELSAPKAVNALCAHEQDEWPLGACESGQLLRWNLNAQGNQYEEVHRHKHPLRSLAYLPQRKLIVVGCAHGELLLFNAENMDEYKIINSRHRGSVQTVAFSPDGRLMSSASLDGDILSWKIDRASSMEDIAIMVPARIQNRQRIFSMQFDGSSTYLLFSDTKALRIRIVEPEELYSQLKKATPKAKMSEQDWKIYVGDDVKRI